MKYLLRLPDDMFRQDLMPYLIVDDIVVFDTACINHKYRNHLLEKFDGLILFQDCEDTPNVSLSLFKWLGKRRIYLRSMRFDYYPLQALHEMMNSQHGYKNQFKYLEHLICEDRPSPFSSSSSSTEDKEEEEEDNEGSESYDDGVIAIFNRCPGLQSLTLHGAYCTTLSRVTPMVHNLKELRSLNIDNAYVITDSVIVSISKHCIQLQFIVLSNCYNLTDNSIVSIAHYCKKIQSLKLKNCNKLTDASFVALSMSSRSLQSLKLDWCPNITDAAILSLAHYSLNLQSLNLDWCPNITESSIFLLARLKTLILNGCPILPEGIRA